MLFAVLSYLEAREDLKNRVKYVVGRKKKNKTKNLAHTEILNEKTGVNGSGTQCNMARPKFKPEC